MFDVPILLIVFKRKDTLLKILEVIQQINPSKIYIASDAAKSDNPDDLKKNEAVKKCIESFPFSCEVVTNFQKENLGCGKGPKAAIDWFFKHEEIGIILEDDCLPDVSFFEFCRSLLQTYENDYRIMSISGNNYLSNNINISSSFYFTKYPNIWGWATWRRAWKLMDWEMNDYIKFINQNTLSEYVNTQSEFWYWKKIFDNVYNNESAIECWDYQWLYSIWKNHGYGIAPAVNLVKNIGFDDDATHTNHQPIWYNNVTIEKLTSITYPDEIMINQEADDYQFNHIINRIPMQNNWQKFRKKISIIKNKLFPNKLIWQNNEYFDPIWQERIKSMSLYLLPNDKVVDLGCGMMWLKKFLKNTNIYIPVDYKQRSEDTIVCDFNNAEFPKVFADVFFVSGCLEYVENYNWFIENISNHSSRCVVSYCTTDKFNNISVRENLMWKNHLSESDIIAIFKKHGFILKDTILTDLNNQIFYFTK
jgi:hypothetical protein